MQLRGHGGLADAGAGASESEADEAALDAVPEATADVRGLEAAAARSDKHAAG